MVTWSADSSRVPREQQLRDSLIRAVDGNGATPSTLLELLDVLTSEDAWRKLSDERGRSFDRRGGFRDFVTARRPYGIQLADKEQLVKYMALQHREEREPYLRKATVARMAMMRNRVNKLLCEDLEPELPVGRPEGAYGAINSRDTRINCAGMSDTSDRVVARLKRDAPKDPEAAAWYARVASGQARPNRAAREMGWRSPRIVLSTPDRIAESLRKHMHPDALARLIEILNTPENGKGASK